jgi:hypothetical protein
VARVPHVDLARAVDVGDGLEPEAHDELADLP